MDDRRAKIEKGLEDAETAAYTAISARAERSEAAVAEARKEAAETSRCANKIADDTRNEILAEARSESERVTTRAREEIVAGEGEGDGRAPRPGRRPGAGGGRKLMRSDMNTATQRRLVEEFLSEVPAGEGRTPRRRATDAMATTRDGGATLRRRRSRSDAATTRSIDGA